MQHNTGVAQITDDILSTPAQNHWTVSGIGREASDLKVLHVYSLLGGVAKTPETVVQH